MTITIVQNQTAISPGNTTVFSASGGSGSYTFAVQAGGAGGTIDGSGNYQAPLNAVITAAKGVDTIIVTDTTTPTPQTASAQVIVGFPIFLFQEIIQSFMGLDNEHCYLLNEKIREPKDTGIYVVIGVRDTKIVGNIKSYAITEDNSGLNANQYLNAIDYMTVDVYSRGPAARDQKGDVLLAVNSDYSANQQSYNSFRIFPLPPDKAFRNLSALDGALIPFRFQTTVAMQYAYQKTNAAAYFDSLGSLEVVANGDTPGTDELIGAGNVAPLPYVISGGGA